ncbi:MAG: excinuclease ABC subunit UvrA [Planctomycetota bacterium]|nr:excinuclease ABC subunit UvrA [Planctomycetota bacterium]
MAHSPWCGLPVESRSPESVVQELLRDYAGQRCQVLAPLIRDRKGAHRALFDDLRKKGYVRVRVDGEVLRIEEVGELHRYKRHTIEVVVDRLKPDPADSSRLREAVDAALDLGDGELVVLTPDADHRVSTLAVCPETGRELPTLEPRLFSFNSPHGACPGCEGLGTRRAPSAKAVVRDPELTLREGALAVTQAKGGALLFPRVRFEFLEKVADANGFDLDTPWRKLSKKAQRVILHGAGKQRFEDSGGWNGDKFKGTYMWRRQFRGVLGELERCWKRGTQKKRVERYLTETVCSDCAGTRLNEAARWVKLGDTSLTDLSGLPVQDLVPTLESLELTGRQQRIARDLLTEIVRRTAFLTRVGLGYLTLDRAADSLSGGEAQRIRLAAQLGAGLQGVLYVLDEPSIGLHAHDHGQLLGALSSLVDGGNSVVVVEHDEATLRAADWLIDVGPGAGRHGGRVVGAGTPAEIAELDTPTGRALRGEIVMPTPDERRAGNGNALRIEGARAFNLKDVDVEVPLGTFTVITGVSGSGKSTLIGRTLRPALLRHLEREGPEPGDHDRILGLEHVDDMVVVDASPIGRTTRSNPATYTKVLTPIRDLFAALPEARMRGYDKSRFSFNIKGGRCESCGGAGATLVELQFLAPVTVPCSECGGKRFQAETLDVRYRGHSISDVLNLTAADALELFLDHPKIGRPLALMVDVGLGYLTLGQPSTTISGGEAQRIKLVTHLQKRPRGHTIYLLDEPTTGLHMEDVGRLVHTLQRLVDLGNTVLVIEHNLELVWAADHAIDLGPDGGEGGGCVVALGTPEELAQHQGSYTGAALRELAGERTRLQAKRPVRKEQAPTDLVLEGVRTHNLKSIDVSIPRESLTVITGPSGSGKSSLALDTIHAEGRRRFVESLSTYARQFLGTKDRPPFEKATGLGPSVAVEARTVGSHPRSTVATTTELHDHLRVLFARAGTPRCPEHGQALEQRDPAGVTRRILADAPEQAKGWILAPIWGHGRPHHEEAATELPRLAEGWRSAGFARAMVDGAEFRLEELPEAGPESDVDLIVDRVAFDAKARARVAEAVEQAASVAHCRVSAMVKGGERLEYATGGACTACGFTLDTPLEPRHFSFNTHAGACPQCDGLGESVVCDGLLLVTCPEKSLLDGAIGGKLGRYLTKGKGYYEFLLRTLAKQHRIKLEKPFEELTEKQQALLLYGHGAQGKYQVEIEKSTRNVDWTENFSAAWPGLCGQIDAWHQKTDDPEWAALLEEVMSRRECPSCKGERLAPAPRHVTLQRKRLPELLRMTVEEGVQWFEGLAVRKKLASAIAPVRAEIQSRLRLLDKVGLGYVTLDRATATLSGGEARRVRLSASLGSELVGVCYVLDEPTVGLHPRDIDQLADALVELKERGNTVIVVEHDGALMRRSDWIVDIGPGAGEHGGTIVASGPPDEVAAHPTSGTAAYLRGESDLAREISEDALHDGPSEELGERPKPLRLKGATLHNLKGVDLQVPFGEITGVCGPSGSGKSTLVLDTLVPALRGERPEGRWTAFTQVPGLRTVVVDASPIGRSPHSVPATYAGVMVPLRELFARTPDARMRGYGPAHFSFNSNRGRCPVCEGRGSVLVEMQFLADLWLTCEECDGRRYQPEVLQIRYRGKTIADVLAMSVSEAHEFFKDLPKIARVLQTLADVGLGYLRLGQSSTTLSGGEAQRVKLASELFRAAGPQRSVLLLDEPSTGLAATDVVHLARALARLARRGDAVVVIEHHTELLRVCDRLVEMGPEGGAAGGQVLGTGTPEQLMADPNSITGPWLAPERALRPKSKPRARRAARTAVKGGAR